MKKLFEMILDLSVISFIPSILITAFTGNIYPLAFSGVAILVSLFACLMLDCD